MNQTKKRLSIINLAISITDIETIQLQILQLGPLRTDEKIQEIITTLKAENYAQAQGLITTYIETPMKEILQRTFQKEQEKRKIQDNNTIDEFNLLAEPENNSEIKTLDFNDMMELSDDVAEEKPKEVQKNIDFDSLLNIDKDDILPNNIKLNTSHTSSNTFWDEPEELNMQTDDIQKDTFFDIEEDISKTTEETLTEVLLTNDLPETTQNSAEDIFEEELTKNKVIIKETDKESLEEIYTKEEIQEEETQEEDEYEEAKDIETFKETPREALEELKPQKREDEAEKHRKYKAIPYIDQKFKNMHVQYPPVVEISESFDSVDAWLLQISNNGYSEEDIEEMIKKIDSLSVEHKEEASQLLLATAATESKYAQFRLARTLYKGEILQKNLPESFTLINRLATNDDYPEAICDLAQFYEYGIGIDKDKKKAELLYEEAMSLGIKRAMDHYERIRKQNSSIFSFLKK